MADAITAQNITDGDRLFIGKYTNISDGTGENLAIKVDVSTLLPNANGNACTGVKINRIWAQTQGMGVDIFWGANISRLCINIPENQLYTLDYSLFGGLPNNGGGTATGDVEFSTVNASSGDRYTIILECIKTYASN